ncbi:MAG: DUF4214 domain-containing protein [Gammaproteobacteria bacterium]|nr:DUF4214 domain-containing protein [Gammaproteobacteria bacterium]
MRAYIAYYGRSADAAGLAYWAERLRLGGGDLSVIIEPFGVSAEFSDRYASLDQQTLVENLYRQLFGREPDAPGLAFYTGELAAGRMTLQTIALNIIYGVQGEDVTVVENRLAASEYFVSCLEQNVFEYPAIPVAVSVLSSVGSASQSLSNAIAEIDGFANVSGNQPPYAGPLSFVADEGIVYVEAELIGFDPDNDIVSFQLLSPANGSGYTDAHIGSESGRLYLTLDGTAETVEISYNVSDGQLFSDPASLVIRISDSTEERGLGAEEIDAATYASFDIVRPWGNLLGAPGEEPAIPTAVDLSANFPLPGDQGRQGSCVGWATAYAIKSYFEKREIGWELDRREHVFSPAFIFNAIALPGCGGSYPNDALERLSTVGAATMDKMSYTDQECSTQPNAGAVDQAYNYRIQSWGTLRTVADMKAQLANRRPVLLGIQTYPSFNALTGPDAVYNTFSGSPQGGHAVAIVGYDDDRYGGAFRVINSWSTNWGDGGYFWFPYDAVSEPNVFMAAFSLEDRANDETPVEPPDPTPPPAGDLPNLEVLSWSANYDPRPGGAGSLQFEIANTGTTVASAGAYVNLMLSLDDRITGDDIFVIYEPIPFDLMPGGSAYRDEASALPFSFPDTVQPGTYLMAVWVDDLDSVTESNENDNVSFGDPLQIENTLPDLVVDSWYAEWQFGTGTLTYTVLNQGSGIANGGWDVNLMLSTDQMLGNNDDLYLAYDTTPFPLASGESVYRDWASPLTFSVGGVQPGWYLMALWVDDLNQVAESNERNNESWGWEAVSFGWESPALGADSGERDAAPEAVASTEPQRQYNARRLPEDAQIYRVKISDGPDGERSMQVLGEASEAEQLEPGHGKAEVLPSKTNKAANPRLFPVQSTRAMPTAGGE